MATPPHIRAELRGGIVTALQGATSVTVPLLLFMGLFGAVSLAAAFWATLVAVTLTPLLRLVLGGSPALVMGPRAASLATYAGLVLQLCLANAAPGADALGTGLSLSQFRVGLAAGSLMFVAASALVLLSGWLGLGNAFKMIPTPVTAGISNGTAMLLIWLAAKQIVSSNASAALIALSMVLVFALWPRLVKHAARFALVPGVLVAMLAGLALAVLLEPAAANATVAPAPPGWGWVSMLLWPDLAEQAPGKLLLIGLPGAVTLALVMILESFTTASVMQTRFGVHSHANRELLTLGTSNLASAVLGGVPCTPSTIYSLAFRLAGGRGKLAALACLALTGMLFLGLNPWLMAIPAGLMAGLLILQAVPLANPAFVSRLGSMIKTRQWRASSSQDMGFWLTFAISLVGFFGNLIWACFMGIGLSCLAVLRRVSDNLTAQWTYLDHYRSRRVRSPGEADTLSWLTHRVAILRLTGHLFFGNSMRLAQLADELHSEVVAVVVDVSQVHDVDPSGMDALDWLLRVLTGRELMVVVTGLKRSRSADLRHALKDKPKVRYLIDLDHGLEACEDRVLFDATVVALPLVSRPLENNHLLQDLTAEEITGVLLLGETREVGKGEILFKKDTRADGVWLLEEGHVTILSGGGGESTRLATFGPGQFVGEMGFIDGRTRSATAQADSPVRALLLDNQSIAALVERHPAAALKITRNIARELSYRVRSSSALLSDESTEADSVWSNSALAYSRF